jgi:squalene-hopene/tetraprenyl-beta-curcumene cyclase
VPDADDTPGALIALWRLGKDEPRVREAAIRGVRWLLDLQNSDGGMPTFCRGWTGLPFDRSGADLTAHALLAWSDWCGVMPLPLNGRVARAMDSAHDYLIETQRRDGAWLPLWFGNEHVPCDANPTYGTARVLPAMIWREANRAPEESMADRGLQWLIANQNADGGWGGAKGPPSSIEETALSIQALATQSLAWREAEISPFSSAIKRGASFLIERVHSDSLGPSPIGFYFAKLWYYEKLYPLIFTVGALSRVKEAQRRQVP